MSDQYPPDILKNAPPASRRDRASMRSCFALLLTPVALFLIAFTGYHLYLSRQLEKSLDALRADGYATTIEELEAMYPEPPPGENAAEIYLEAFELASKRDEAMAAIATNRSGDRKLLLRNDQTRESIERYLAANERTLKSTKQATTMTACRFPVRLRDGAKLETTHLYGLRHAHELLLLLAVLQSIDGDVDGCFETTQILFAVSHAVDLEPILISQLVAFALRINTLEVLALMFGEVQFTEPQLLEILDGVSRCSTSDALVRAFNGEMVIASEIVDDTYKNSRYMRRYWTYPKDKLVLLDIMHETLLAAKQPLNRMSVAAKAVDIKRDGKLNSDGINKLRFGVDYPLISALLLPAVNPVFANYLRCEALVRVTLAALAVERYRLKYGALPETLDALVPEFLEALPVGPHHADPLIYHRFDNGYTIYATGANGIDDGGIKYDSPARNGEWLDVPFTVVHAPPGANAP